MPTGFEGLKIRQVAAPSVFGGMRQKNAPLMPQPWNELNTKSALRGFADYLDIPSGVAHLGQGLANQGVKNPMPNNYGIPAMEDPLEGRELPQLDLASKVPTSNDLYSIIEKYTGKNLEPHPQDAEERIRSSAIRTGAGLIGGGALGRVLKEGNALIPFLGRPQGVSGFAKQGALGATVGGGSQVLQEGGVDPLPASILAALATGAGASAIKGTGNIFSHYAPSKIAKRSVERKATAKLKDSIGEKNIDKVLKNLDKPTPFNADLTTAEMAEDQGLYALHRALAPNINPIKEKNVLNNQLMENQLRKLGTTELEDATLGTLLQQQLNKNLNKAVNTRAENAAPLYKTLSESRTGHDIPTLKNFLVERGEFAKGGEKKAVDYVNKLIAKESADENLHLLGGKLKTSNDTNKDVLKQLEAAMKKGDVSLNNPVELDNVLTDLGDKVGAAKKSGKKSLANFYGQAKQKLEFDTEGIPELVNARTQYRTDSKGVNAIEQEPLLKKIVQTDLKDKTQFVLSPEQIPKKILNGTANNTKALMAQIKLKPELVKAVRGAYINKLLGKSTLASGENKLSYDKYRKFLQDPSNKAKLPLIFEKEQMQVLKDVFELVKKRNAVDTVGRAVGSNTQSETTLLNNLVNFGAPKSIKLAKKGVEWLAGAREQKVQELVAAALTDPKIAKALLSPNTSAAEAKTLLNRINLPVATNIAVRELTRRGE